VHGDEEVIRRLALLEVATVVDERDVTLAGLGVRVADPIEHHGVFGDVVRGAEVADRIGVAPVVERLARDGVQLLRAIEIRRLCDRH
jgi:hypothetical protein